MYLDALHLKKYGHRLNGWNIVQQHNWKMITRTAQGASVISWPWHQPSVDTLEVSCFNLDDGGTQAQ
jgi:hypothetical protein